MWPVSRAGHGRERGAPGIKTNLCDTVAKGATGEGIRHGASCSNAGLVIDDLNRTIRATAFEGPGEAGNVGRGLRLALLPALVRIHPSSIAADDESFLLAGRGGGGGGTALASGGTHPEEVA